MNPSWFIKRVTYEETRGNYSPYIIYVDHDHKEIILAIRGLNLVRESDYKVLMDIGLEMQMFDGGFVHHGLLKEETRVLNQEAETLRGLLRECEDEYMLIFIGLLLGSGVAALMTVIVVNRSRLFWGGLRGRG